MHETEEKTLNSLIPLGLIHAFQAWFRGFRGQRVGDPRPCPHCGEATVWKNGYRTDRLFAVLITEDGFDEITVEIQRYQCSARRHPYDGDISELFYEDLEYAKPVVDLCLFHAATNPFHACERILQNQYGLHVDRDTVQHYAERFGDGVVYVSYEPLIRVGTALASFRCRVAIREVSQLFWEGFNCSADHSGRRPPRRQNRWLYCLDELPLAIVRCHNG